MIIIMSPKAAETQINAVTEKLKQFDLDSHVSRGIERTVIGVPGDKTRIDKVSLQALSGVERVIRVTQPYKIVARTYHDSDTVIDIDGVKLGGPQIQIIAGPCSVETLPQMKASAAAVAAAGCRMLRGGAFKPRTSPYSFQGVGVAGLEMMKKVARPHKMPIVTELMDVRQLDAFMEHEVDVIQIGTRNMQNYDLLKEVGKIHIPVVLKRGMSATIREWLMSAEYIAAGGNHNIIFCERGVRSFETYYRNVLDVTAIPVLKRETHLPVIVDPSHAGGKAWMVPALSRAAVAAGADGLLVEMHPTPCEAWCDADQAISPAELNKLMGELKITAEAIGRTI